ncbi:glucoside xylosyltransferase 1-like [Palaemon carinicauda]|uniref:glucoside xylosyltransferase 1-like n=1 Tax=Palaemon carinicauda TaxID=392227 RepID=UPI0035B600C1
MDALIAVDTDVLFMQPPEDLWDEFGNFERRQISGIAPCLSRYGRNFTAFPAYGFSGLNTGVVLMNLTRMRSFGNGWVPSITDSFMKYRKNFSLSDQDILTNFFSEDNSKYLYELGCEWNYRATLCQSDWNKCAAAASRGVALLHGCDGTFRVNKEPTIRAIFQAWQRYRIGSPVKELVSLLEEALSTPFTRGCVRLSNIKDIFLKGFKRRLASQQSLTAGEKS